MVKLPKRFSVGERIFAKVRGYPPWPAKIESITDPNTKHAKYHVVFYGTKEIGTCKIEDIFQYADNKDKFSKTVRRKYFHEGMQELEEDLKKYPNPVSDSSKDLESAENVPENVSENISEKDNDSIISTSFTGDGDVDTGNLIIDEGKKKAIKRKSQIVQSTPDSTEVKKKRGRKSMATILAENAAKQEKQDTSQDSQDEDAEKKNVSRSGRKIKPKRFHDYSDAEISADSAKNDQPIRSRTKSKTEESNENPETYIPIKKRMSTDKDGKLQVKEQIDEQSQAKIKTLRAELHMGILDTQIKASLGLDHANADDCLEAMEQILELQITPLMLKKHSAIVQTVKRLRRYIGNLKDWKLSEEETVVFKEKAEQIKRQAELIYDKFKSLFTIPDGQTFWSSFVEQVEQFKEHTKDMSQEEVYSLLVDPTESIKLNEDTSTDTKPPIKSETTSASAANKSVAENDHETK